MRNIRYSCAEPPWGELVAVNANTGDIAWRVPLGEYPELVAKGIKTGAPMLGGGITTAGNLVFIGATIDGISARSMRGTAPNCGAKSWMRPRIRFRRPIWVATASSMSQCRPAAAGSCEVRRRTR